MKSKNAVLLCRISDLKQDDGYSLDAQEQYGKEYCSANEFTLQKVFKFVETGSKAHKRVKFNQMMKFIENYISDAKSSLPLRLIVEKPDRLTRNFTNREQLQKFVVSGSLEIHYYKDRRIFDKSCGPADIFTDDMMTSVSKYIALNIAREVDKGMRQKAKNGWFPGRAPLGYKNIRDGSVGKHGRKESRVIIDTEVADDVKKIFLMRANEKLSYENIATKIKNNPLLHPRVRRLTKSSVEKILKNPFYTGDFLWKEKMYQGKHKAMISEIIWEACQNLRGKSLTKRPNGVFSQMLACGEAGCGSVIIYDPKVKTNKSRGTSKTYHYYHCADGRKFHKHNSIKQVNEDEINLEKRKKLCDRHNSEQLLKNAECLLELCKELKSLWIQMPEGKRLEVINKLCSNPSLKGRSIEYCLKKPFKILAEINKNKDFDKWCA